MTTTIQTAPMANTARLARYRQAEQDLWHAYGLEPIERFVEVSLPRAVVRLRVLEIGAGEPAVFIPGTGGTGPYWAPLIRELPGIRCVMIDRPGWGLSSPLDYRDRDYGETAAAILGGALDAMGLDRVDVVGHRSGICGACGWPNANRGESGGSWPSAVGRSRTCRTTLHPASRVTAGCAARPDPIERADAPRPAGGDWPRRKPHGRPDGRLSSVARCLRPRNAIAANERAMVRSILLRDGWRAGFVPTDADLGAVTAPFRMVFGSADPTGSVDLWRHFTSRLAQGELKIVEGAGHMPWWDEPTVVGRSVREFLSGPAG